MPTFQYQAVNAEGQAVNGVLFGTSLDAALGELSRQGLQVSNIGVAASPHDPLNDAPPTSRAGVAEVVAERVIPSTEQRSYIATSVWGPLMGRVPLKDLAFFFRQASTMLNSGVPIVQSMNTLAGQTHTAKFREIVREIGAHVEAGRPMTAGMQRYPEVFTNIMVALTRAGEEGGFLDRALAQVADYLDREIALRNLYRRVTFMPKAQVFLSMLIIIVANAIINAVNPNAMKLTSPLTSWQTWLWLGPLCVAIFLFFRVGLANPAIKGRWDAFVSNIPYLGKILRELSMAKFGRAFGALYKGGVPVTRAIQLSADACGNEYLRAKIYPAVQTLETGAGITETLRSTGAFNPIVIDMVATGETTGNLDQMLNKMAEFYEDEAATKSTQLATVVGIFLGLCVAVYIAFIVINFYTGYFAGVFSAGEGE